MQTFQATDTGCILVVRVTPRSPRPGVTLHDGRIAIRVGAAPEKGRATAEAAERLAGALGVPRSDVRLKSGAASRTKRFQVAGVGAEEAAGRLRASMPGR